MQIRTYRGEDEAQLLQVWQHAMIYDRIEYDVLNRLYRQYVRARRRRAP